LKKRILPILIVYNKNALVMELD